MDPPRLSCASASVRQIVSATYGFSSLADTTIVDFFQDQIIFTKEVLDEQRFFDFSYFLVVGTFEETKII